MYILNAGRLKHKITIKGYKDIPNSIGSMVPTLCDIKTVWAEVKPMRGNEFLTYYREENELIYKITIRYMDEITPNMTVKFGKRIFDITSVINVEEANKVIELMCRERIGKVKKESNE